MRHAANVHGDVTGLEHGADLHGERLPALVALIDPGPGAFCAHPADAFEADAMRANRSLRSDSSLDSDANSLFVMKALGGQNGRRVYNTCYALEAPNPILRENT